MNSPVCEQEQNKKVYTSMYTVPDELVAGEEKPQ